MGRAKRREMVTGASDGKTGKSDGVSEQEPIERRTMAPFIGALAIIVAVVIGVLVLNAVGVIGGDGPSPDREIRTAVVGQNDGLQRLDYARFQTYTCKAQYSTEADVIGKQRDSVVKDGQRYIDEVSDVRIDGDHATATVTTHFDKTPDSKPKAQVTLLREDGAWKVCAPA